MNEYVDVHNHITDTVPINSIYNTYRVENILKLDEVKAEIKTVGVHPGYIHCDIPWDYIIKKVTENPTLLIGEVGLDKNCNFKDQQLKVFIDFINISKKYNRSLILHCVKSWGRILDSLDRHFDKDIPHLFHGYSGSYETLITALKGNSYFSFSLRELQRSKMENIIKYIPTEKIMIESDMSDEAYKVIGSSNYLKRIEESYRLLSEIKGEPLVDIIRIIKNNFTTFIS